MMPTTPLGTWLTSIRVSPGNEPGPALGAEVATRRAARSSARSARRGRAPRSACLRALPDSQPIRSRISSWRSSTRSWKRSSASARSSIGVRAHAAWARRARRNASATSASLDCGMCASGCPVSGEDDHDRLAGRRDQPLGQLGGVLGLEGQRGAGVVLGVVRPGDPARGRRLAHSYGASVGDPGSLSYHGHVGVLTQGRLCNAGAIRRDRDYS